MIIFLYLLPLFTFAQDFQNQSLTVGARSSYFSNSEVFDNSFFYYVPEYSSETFGEAIGRKQQLKLRVLDYYSSNESAIIDPLDASVEFFTDKNSFQIGFIRYRFSETFGLQVLDVANPRDYSEFIFNDLSWSKRSVFGMNDTYKWEKLQVQFMLTLWPNGDRLPYKDSTFDPTTDSISYSGGVVERPWFKDFEYGTRAKYLFTNGIDLSLLYYHHFSRPTFINLRPLGTGFKAEVTHHMVDSFGTSASMVMSDWVLRVDALHTLNDFVQETLLTYEKEDHSQLLAGIDRTYEDFLLGFQFQSDFSGPRHFYGLKSEYTNTSWWKPSVMLFKSIENNDQWLQLKSTFDMADWKFALIYDNIHGSKKEENLFGLYRDLDRFLLDLSYSY